jgi:hypothetical protein
MIWEVSIALFGHHRSQPLTSSADVICHLFRPFIFCKNVAEHVLNLLFEEVNITITIGICCINNLLPAGLEGSLKMEFKFGDESNPIIPTHQFPCLREFVDKVYSRKAWPLDLELMIGTLVLVDQSVLYRITRFQFIFTH